MKGRYILAGIVVIVIAAAAAGSSSTTSSGPTNSPALVTTTTSTTPAPAASAAPPQTFKGNGSENLGTINVPAQSTLRWHCPTCGNGNFIVGNKPTDNSTIDINGLNVTSGKTALDAGTYHDVAVNTEGGAWTITITAR